MFIHGLIRWRLLLGIVLLSFLVSCSDGGGDNTTVTTPEAPVVNQAPVANAGADQTVEAGSTVTLDGSASKDVDGKIVSYSWKQVSGTSVELSSSESSKVTFLSPVSTLENSLVFELTVSDAQSSIATVQVTVNVKKSLVGVFVDAPVAGLHYATATRSSVTDSSGKFAYDVLGEDIQFSIGDYAIGSANAAPIVHVFDLENNGISTQLERNIRTSQIMQSFDENKGQQNVIKIPSNLGDKLVINTQYFGYEQTQEEFDSKLGSTLKDLGYENSLVTKDQAELAARNFLQNNVDICPLPIPTLYDGTKGNLLTCIQRSKLNYYKKRIEPFLDNQIQAAFDRLQVVEESFSEEAVQRSLDTNPVLLAFETMDSVLDLLDSFEKNDGIDLLKNAGLVIHKAALTFAGATLMMDSLNMDKEQAFEYQKKQYEVSDAVVKVLTSSAECYESIKSTKCVDLIIKTVKLYEKAGFIKIDETLIKSNLDMLENGVNAIKALQKFKVKGISTAKINRAVDGISASLTAMGSGIIDIAYGSDKENRPFLANAASIIIEKGIQPALDIMSSCYKIDGRAAIKDKLSCVSKATQKLGGDVTKIVAALVGIEEMLRIKYLDKSNASKVSKLVLEQLIIGGYDINDYYENGKISTFYENLIKNAGSKLNLIGMGSYLDVFSIAEKGEIQPIFSVNQVAEIVRPYFALIELNASTDFDSDEIAIEINYPSEGVASVTGKIASSKTGLLVCSIDKEEILKLNGSTNLKSLNFNIAPASNKFSFEVEFLQSYNGHVLCSSYTSDGKYENGKSISMTKDGRDEDMDGLPVDWELKYGLNPHDKTDASKSNDHDNLTNLEEFENNTNPNVEDTDHDTFDDWQEIKAGTNPQVPTSKPLNRPIGLKAVSTQLINESTWAIKVQWTSVPDAVNYVVCFASISLESYHQYGCSASEFVGVDNNPKVINKYVKLNEFEITDLDLTSLNRYIQVVAIDANGISSPASREILVTLTMPSPQINQAEIQVDGRAIVKGTSIKGATITLTWSDNTISTTQADDTSGTWSLISTQTNHSVGSVIKVTATLSSLLSEEATANLTMVSIPTQTSCPKPITATLFKETFDDIALDPNKWDTDLTGGSILIKDGKLQMISNGTNRFPVAQTKTNPFPTSGNYSFYCKSKYNTIEANGTGACVAVQKMIENGSQSLSYDSGSTLQLWADTRLGGAIWRTASSIYSGNEYITTNTANDLEEHTYETCIIGSQALAYKDGVKVGEATLPNSWVSPTKIWLGNPVTGSTGYPWSIFETDTIEVRKLEEGIDPTGWIQNPTTDHYYKAIENCGNWEECQVKAQSLGANLVTINDEAENNWVYQKFGEIGGWIGLTDKNSEGNWEWVTGEPLTFMNWSPLQPYKIDGSSTDYTRMFDSPAAGTDFWGMPYWYECSNECSETAMSSDGVRGIIERINPPSEPNMTANPFIVQANDAVGTLFTVPASNTQCVFNATGTWRVGDEPIDFDANGLEAWSTPSKTLQSAPLMALLTKRSNGQLEFVGASRQMSVNGGETLRFLANDAVDTFYNNTGSLSVSWTCQ